MSSPAQRLGLRVRIPLEAGMPVCISSVFVLPCVGSGLATGLIARPRSPTFCVMDAWLQINSDGNRPEGHYER
jgi:hypothetical protein